MEFEYIGDSREHVEWHLETLRENKLISIRTTTPYTLVITKVNKEADAARNGAVKIQAEVDELMNMIRVHDDDPAEQERPAKRQKIAHDNGLHDLKHVTDRANK